MKSISIAVLAALWLGAGNAGGYSNARFGFSFEYPRVLFTLVRESDNGDGLLLSAERPFIECRVYGRYNVMHDDLSTLRLDILDSMRGARVTCERRRGNRFVLAGNFGNRAFHCMRMVSGNTVYSIDAFYDRNAARYGGALDGIVRSFRIWNAGDGQ